MGSSIANLRLTGVPFSYHDVYVLGITHCVVVVWPEGVVVYVWHCTIMTVHFFSLPGVTDAACWRGCDRIK